jgi:pyrimidine-nucleoside phosphorylase
MSEKAIADGSAFSKFRELVITQGGDVNYVDNPIKLPKAKLIETVNAPQSGNLSQIHARLIGEAAVVLGAGRATKKDKVDHTVGFIIHHKVGDVVKVGEPLFTIHANDKKLLEQAREDVLKAHLFSENPVPPLPLFYN